jgi:hypothetical protein
MVQVCRCLSPCGIWDWNDGSCNLIWILEVAHLQHGMQIFFYLVDLTPSVSNIKDFDILLYVWLFVLFKKNKIIIYFICDLLYYLQYFKHNFSFFIFAKKKLNKTSSQTLQSKTQNPLYYGTEEIGTDISFFHTAPDIFNNNRKSKC